MYGILFQEFWVEFLPFAKIKAENSIHVAFFRSHLFRLPIWIFGSQFFFALNLWFLRCWFFCTHSLSLSIVCQCETVVMNCVVVFGFYDSTNKIMHTKIAVLGCLWRQKHENTKNDMKTISIYDWVCVHFFYFIHKILQCHVIANKSTLCLFVGVCVFHATLLIDFRFYLKYLLNNFRLTNCNPLFRTVIFFITGVV